MIENISCRAGWLALAKGIMMIFFACAASTSFAARPLEIDDADPLEPNQFKIEAGVLHDRYPAYAEWEWPIGLGYGIVHGLEANLGLGGQFEQLTETITKEDNSIKKNGLGDLTLNVKWQFLHESSWLPRQAIVPSIKFPTSNRNYWLDGREIDYDIMWIASKTLTEKMGAHLNAGYSFIGKPPGKETGNLLHYGVALDYRIIAPLQWVGEVYSEKELLAGMDSNIMFNTGLRWNPLEQLIFDAAAGSRISGSGRDFTATAGLTWTFGIADTKERK